MFALRYLSSFLLVFLGDQHAAGNNGIGDFRGGSSGKSLRRIDLNETAAPTQTNSKLNGSPSISVISNSTPNNPSIRPKVPLYDVRNKSSFGSRERSQSRQAPSVGRHQHGASFNSIQMAAAVA